MFVRYFVELPFRNEDVEHVLRRDPESWLPTLARQANSRGERLLAHVGTGGGLRIHRTVEVVVGSPVALTSKVILPLAWRPTSASGLLPSMDADLELAPLGADACQLAMNARYEPPLRGLGKALDQALLHRVAEATVKDLLDRIGELVRRDMRIIAAAGP
jgi:hypothetical protein